MTEPQLEDSGDNAWGLGYDPLALGRRSGPVASESWFRSFGLVSRMPGRGLLIGRDALPQSCTEASSCDPCFLLWMRYRRLLRVGSLVSLPLSLLCLLISRVHAPVRGNEQCSVKARGTPPSTMDLEGIADVDTVLLALHTYFHQGPASGR